MMQPAAGTPVNSVVTIGTEQSVGAFADMALASHSGTTWIPQSPVSFLSGELSDAVSAYELANPLDGSNPVPPDPYEQWEINGLYGAVDDPYNPVHTYSELDDNVTNIAVEGATGTLSGVSHFAYSMFQGGTSTGQTPGTPSNPNGQTLSLTVGQTPMFILAGQGTVTPTPSGCTADQSLGISCDPLSGTVVLEGAVENADDGTPLSNYGALTTAGMTPLDYHVTATCLEPGATTPVWAGHETDGTPVVIVEDNADQRMLSSCTPMPVNPVGFAPLADATIPFEPGATYSPDGTSIDDLAQLSYDTAGNERLSLYGSTSLGPDLPADTNGTTYYTRVVTLDRTTDTFAVADADTNRVVMMTLPNAGASAYAAVATSAALDGNITSLNVGADGTILATTYNAIYAIPWSSNSLGTPTEVQPELGGTTVEPTNVMNNGVATGSAPTQYGYLTQHGFGLLNVAANGDISYPVDLSSELVAGSGLNVSHFGLSAPNLGPVTVNGGPLAWSGSGSLTLGTPTLSDIWMQTLTGENPTTPSQVDFLGWIGPGLSQPTVDPTIPASTLQQNTADLAYTAVFEPEVTFQSNGGSTVASEPVPYIDPATAPSAPTRTGYTFAGWYSDSGLTDAWSFASPVYINTTLYAAWTIDQYTVSFNSNGGSAVSTQTVDYDNTAAAPTAPTRTGYTFAGWFTNSGLSQAWDSSTPITSSMTLYAAWKIDQNGGGSSGSGDAGSSTVTTTTITPTTSTTTSAPPPPAPTVLPPLPASIPAASFGAPATATTTAGHTTTIAETHGKASAEADIPAGALPAGTTVRVFPVVNAASMASTFPTNDAYIASFAVSWGTPDGAAPTATSPITLTITDPSIVVGDTVYRVIPSGKLVAAGTATRNGIVTITFTSDPDFVVVAPPKLTLGSPRALFNSRQVRVRLRCSRGIRCVGTATLTHAHNQLAHATFNIRRGHTATVTLRLSRDGHTLITAIKSWPVHAALHTSVADGTKSTETLTLSPSGGSRG
jgi:uncharacterized repeat protein (TIGR02543 family)